MRPEALIATGRPPVELSGRTRAIGCAPPVARVGGGELSASSIDGCDGGRARPGFDSAASASASPGASCRILRQVASRPRASPFSPRMRASSLSTLTDFER